MTPSSPAIRRLGLALFGVYLVVAGLTLRLSGQHLRPLFEGIGPSSPYRWVNPPPEFKAGNVAPTPSTTEVDLGPAGTPLTGLSSSDSQLVLNLPEGAVAPRPGDAKVAFTITPLDSRPLGATPPDLRPNGNAYRVQAVYQPSGQAVEKLDKPGNVVITVPEPFQALLYSGDGRTWEQTPANAEGTASTAGGEFSRLGYYLGATQSVTGTTKAGGGGGRGGMIAVVAAVVVLALAFGVGPVLYRRVRDRHAAPASGRPRPRTTGGRSQSTRSTEKQRQSKAAKKRRKKKAKKRGGG